MDYCLFYLKHYYWLYCVYTPAGNEFVACVDRKKVTEHHYYIPGMVQQNV